MICKPRFMWWLGAVGQQAITWDNVDNNHFAIRLHEATTSQHAKLISWISSTIQIDFKMDFENGMYIQWHIIHDKTKCLPFWKAETLTRSKFMINNTYYLHLMKTSDTVAYHAICIYIYTYIASTNLAMHQWLFTIMGIIMYNKMEIPTSVPIH